MLLTFLMANVNPSNNKTNSSNVKNEEILMQRIRDLEESETEKEK